MENKQIEGFRKPTVLDVLKGASGVCLAMGSCKRIEFTGICAVDDVTKIPWEFSFLDVVRKCLNYGFRVASEVEKKDVEIVLTRLGELNTLVVESLHGCKFRLFEYGYCIGILPMGE